MLIQRPTSLKDINKQSGIATVETAIVIALLIILLLASTEFGRLFYHANELTKSTRDTARFISNNALNTAQTMEITPEDSTRAKNLLIYGDILGDTTDAGDRYTMFSGLTPNNIVITENNPYITVEVAWEYQALFGAPLRALGLTSPEDLYTLTAASTMRALE